MVFPAVGEDTYIIDVKITLFDSTKKVFHCHLGKVRREFESHWESIVFVYSKWYTDSKEILNFFAKFKGIVLHNDVKFCEELVSFESEYNVSDYR